MQSSFLIRVLLVPDIHLLLLQLYICVNTSVISLFIHSTNIYQTPYYIPGIILEGATNCKEINNMTSRGEKCYEEIKSGVTGQSI